MYVERSVPIDYPESKLCPMSTHQALGGQAFTAPRHQSYIPSSRLLRSMVPYAVALPHELVLLCVFVCTCDARACLVACSLLGRGCILPQPAGDWWFEGAHTALSCIWRRGLSWGCGAVVLLWTPPMVRTGGCWLRCQLAHRFTICPSIRQACLSP